MPMNHKKYKRYEGLDFKTRTWPDKYITQAPLWCSVDLRDGNQALIVPMNVSEKLEMFNLLLQIGFKQIEVGFPSASQTEFDFMRLLIDRGLIPEDVTVQVLTQAREHLIKKTFESLKNAKSAIVHLYNSTSELQRRVVFKMKPKEIIAIAEEGTRLIKSLAQDTDTAISFEYSPESFTGTELPFALEICEAVMNIWQPTKTHKAILNLPATVEMSTPNIYADQIEWFCRHISCRDEVLISVHSHNDRGTAVAATELALLAGADRVEGTLFGNGERTGNVDIVTLALNMYSQGIDPKLDFHDINHVIKVYEKCTRIPVHVRHPYAGELVYTAFSGSHQDAINKGMKARRDSKSELWEVPYLPIDPSDVGRTFESIIRINSQSGKGGVAYVMEQDFGFVLPKEMQPEFGSIIKRLSDEAGKELMPAEIMQTFESQYLNNVTPLRFIKCKIEEDDTGVFHTKVKIAVKSQELDCIGEGNGPIDAFVSALKRCLKIDFNLTAYHEHALTVGSNSKAVAYIQVEDSSHNSTWGAGIDSNINSASFKALMSALNRCPSISEQISRDFASDELSRGECGG